MKGFEDEENTQTGIISQTEAAPSSTTTSSQKMNTRHAHIPLKE
jgi:hypothetical protein